MDSSPPYEIPPSIFTKMEETETLSEYLGCAQHEKSEAYE